MEGNHVWSLLALYIPHQGPVGLRREIILSTLIKRERFFQGCQLTVKNIILAEFLTDFNHRVIIRLQQV